MRAHPDPPALLHAELRAAAVLVLIGLAWVFSRSPPPPPREPSLPLRLDLNHASLDALTAIPGVGRRTAARLVAARPLRDWAAVRAAVGEARARRLEPHARLE